MVPTSMDTVLTGERLMLAGTGKGTALVALLPQPSRAAAKSRRIIANTSEPDLPMHPPRLMVARRARLALENFQCRGCESFQQVEPLSGPVRQLRSAQLLRAS